MRTRNIIAAFYVAASLSSAVAMAKDSGFRYHVGTSQCINQKGDHGFNKGFFGECGDITAIKLFRQRKIDNADLKYANLRGIQINGLDFSNKDLSGADLTGANLIATDLSAAYMADAKLEKAKFNDGTKLPFSLEEASARAMINIDFIGDRPVDDSILDSILTAENPADLAIQLSEIRRASDSYHARVRHVFESSKKLNAAQIMAFMDANFAQKEIINDIYDQVAANNASEEPNAELNERLVKEFHQQREWAYFANAILLEAINDKIDLKKESKTQALSLASKAIPFTSDLSSSIIFNKLIEAHEFKEVEDKLTLISAANKSGAFSLAGRTALQLIELKGEVTLDTILEAADEFFKQRNQGLGELFARGVAKLKDLQVEELMMLVKRAPDIKNEIVAAGINKLDSLNADQASLLLEVSTYGTKDLVLKKFFSLNDEVSYENFTKLISKANSEKNNLIAANINKITNLSPEQAASVVALASYGGKDVTAKVYLDALTNKISAAQLIAIAQNSNQERNSILANYMGKLNDLNATSTVALANNANYGGKDIVINNFLTRFQGQATTSQIIALAKAANQEGNSILANHLSSITDLNPGNVALIASTANYGGKDLVISNYLKAFKPSLSTAQIIVIARAANQDGNTILSTNLELINDKSVDTIISLMNAASYGAKDIIMMSFINKYTTTISAADIIRLARQANSQGTSMMMANLAKVSPFDLQATLTLVNALSYGNKDIVIKRFIDSQDNLTTDQILTLASRSSNIADSVKTQYLAKISDLDQQNILRLASTLSYGNKDFVLDFYLKKASLLATAELIQIARASSNKTQEFVTSSLKKVNDLTVANALTMKGFFSYGSLDAYLLSTLELVTDLNQTNLMSMANSASNAKDRIIARGLEILLSRQ